MLYPLFSKGWTSYCGKHWPIVAFWLNHSIAEAQLAWHSHWNTIIRIEWNSGYSMLISPLVMRKFFLISLLAVTITPYLLMVLIYNNFGSAVLVFLGFLAVLLSSAHVPMTFYLFVDKDIRSKCRNDLSNSIIIPLALLIISIYAFISAPLYITLIYIVS